MRCPWATRRSASFTRWEMAWRDSSPATASLPPVSTPAAPASSACWATTAPAPGAARALGAGLVIAVEPVAERREMARRMGANVVLDPTKVDAVAEIKNLTGGPGGGAAGGAVGPPG